ncbi:zinc-ribbon domain-containing protein [Bacillus sp. AG4(2022)]|uniref:zinc-ribbon domain-containing protein n=1 Tax=Bacillus sp. AG4(2022) TaxID=2962594 RepID=UPI00288107BC|nr:zinc-ribbon domain-containing protein [Bacillus sp. AG4(2022)]MDT0160393.1 zinc-ribbon domain-containing protein [Bacillus sp. AG4(2022)]
MAILENKLIVKVNSANIKYLSELGYKIPKSNIKEGIEKYRMGIDLEIKVEDLSRGSHSRITKICDDCGTHTENIMYAHLIKQRELGDGKDRCKACSRKKGEQTKRETVPYEKTLEHYAMSNGREYLIKELSEKNNISPRNLHSSANLKLIWECLKCGSEYESTLNNRIFTKSNCPYCAGQKVNETNCLANRRPDIINILYDKTDGYKYTDKSGKKITFKCPDCGSLDEKIIKNVVNAGYSCTKCSDGFSYPEKFMIEVLNQLSIEYKTQKVFDWSQNKRYDFYLPSLKCIIETHGRQHYDNSFYSFGKTLEEEQMNDTLKEELAKINGIERYVVIDCRNSEIDWIRGSLLASSLNVLLDLIEVDWIKCGSYASNSLVKIVCDIYNNGERSTDIISKIVGLNRGTVVRYLKTGVELGWCNYDSKKSVRKEFNWAKSKPIIQLTKCNQFINEWNSISEAARALKIQRTGIGMVCSGKLNSSGGYKWLYKTNE